MESSSGPDMKQKALPSFKLTCAAWPKASLAGGLVQRIEIVEELLFGQLFLGEAPLGLVMGVDEVLHGRSPWLGGWQQVMYMHDMGQMFMGFGSLGHVSPPIG